MKKPKRKSRKAPNGASANGHSLNGPVSVVKVDPAAMIAAMAFADGDARRLEVVNERTVIVRNSPKG